MNPHQEWEARSQYTLSNWFDNVRDSCRTCMRLPAEHADGKCLFEAQSYEPYGFDAAVQLLKARNQYLDDLHRKIRCSP